MDRLLNKSRTSIEVDPHQSVDVETYIEYICALNQNMENMAKSLKIAEGLIEQYQQENAELRQQNQVLGQKVSDLNEEVDYLKRVLMKENDNSVQEKVRELTIKNDHFEIKMSQLAEELQRSQQKVQKLTRMKQEKIQKSMTNYFEFRQPDQRYEAREEELNRQIRSLHWKLEQKEEEIMYMIRRNKMLEGRGNSNLERTKQKEKQPMNGKRVYRIIKDEDRFYTCETENNRSQK